MRKKFVEKHQKSLIKYEPVFNSLDSENNSKMIQLLKWYRNFDPSRTIQKKWVIEYTKNQSLKKVDENLFYHPLSSLCRLASRGLELTEKNKEYIQKKMEFLLASIDEEATPVIIEKPKTVSIDKNFEAAKVFMAEVDHFVDLKIQENIDSKIKDLLLKNNVNKIQINHVINHIKSYLDDYENALELYKTGDEEDKEYGESYGNKIKINGIIKYLNKLLTECEDCGVAKKTERKPRKVKVKTPEQLVKNVKIGETLVQPKQIIGKSAVLIFNEKYKRLYYIESLADNKLSIKGSAVINIDENKSKTYLVKSRILDTFKPILNSIKGIGKLRNALTDNSFKESKGKVSERLSANTNIIWVG